MRIVKMLKFNDENIKLLSEDTNQWDGVEFVLDENSEPLTRLKEVKATVKGFHYHLTPNKIKGNGVIEDYRRPGSSLFNLMYQKEDMERLLIVTPYAHKHTIPILMHANTPTIHYEKRYAKMLAKFFAKTKIRCGIEDSNPLDIIEEDYRWGRDNDVYISLNSVNVLNNMTDFRPFFPILHVPNTIKAYQYAGLLTKDDIMDELTKAVHRFREESERGLYVMINDCIGLPDAVIPESDNMTALIELNHGEAITFNEIIDIVKAEVAQSEDLNDDDVTVII